QHRLGDSNVVEISTVGAFEVLDEAPVTVEPEFRVLVGDSFFVKANETTRASSYLRLSGPDLEQFARTVPAQADKENRGHIRTIKGHQSAVEFARQRLASTARGPRRRVSHSPPDG